MSLRSWLAIPARLAAIHMEIRHMRASTQHLIDAVSALATSVQGATATIREELDKLAAATADGDADAVETQVTTLKGLTTSLDDAVTAAHAAISTVPAAAPTAEEPAPAPAPDQPQT